MQKMFDSNSDIMDSGDRDHMVVRFTSVV